MSVFTTVSEAQARELLGHYGLGALERLEGIAQGVENTNYFLTTTTGEYVLTLFEHIPPGDIPFYVGLMDHLAGRDVVCPAPRRRDDGGMLSSVAGKPAVIVTKLPGAPITRPTPDDCEKAGAILAQVHAAGVDYDASLENPRGREWREGFARQLQPKLTAAENELITSENRFQARHDDTAIPRGIVHGDYFHDNVLWDEEGRGGVIDFYFACDDALLYDVAIAVNDWCVNPDATLDDERVRAFVDGYRGKRPLEPGEADHWAVMLRRAALRTWLGRLGYTHFPRESHITIEKDHAFSRRLLERHIERASELAGALA